MYLRLKFVRAERSSYDIGVQVERRGGEEVMNFCWEVIKGYGESNG